MDPRDDSYEERHGTGGGPADAPRGRPVHRRRFLRDAGLLTGGLVVGSAVGIPSALAAQPPAAPNPGGPLPAPPTALPPGARGPALVSPTRRAARGSTLFGIGYETWFVPGVNTFGSAEATPVLGYYDSMDENVIVQHAKWLTDAGFDFILIDWSNNLGPNWTNGVAQKIIAATMKLMEVYTKIPRHPKFALLLGLDNGSVDTAEFNSQIDLINSTIVADPAYAPMWQLYKGKPLLPIYRGASFSPPPVYDNSSFTVRWMSAFHEITTNPWGDWSWSDREPIVDGPMTPPYGSQDFTGWTLGPNWSILEGPFGPFATTEPNNDKITGSLTSPAFRISERAITFNTAGVDYFQTTNTDYALGDKIYNRNLYFLLDAGTGEVLRHAEPPNTFGAKPFSEPPSFAMAQWDVSDLQGRQVMFQAVSNSVIGSPYGWLAVGNVAQMGSEQLPAIVAIGGNEGPGSYVDWDAHNRYSGATLVRFAAKAFDYEPDVVLIQQWNEFTSPDQYSVEGSNDIEPTTVTVLDGARSDGWGTYYLDLSREVISQYRAGYSQPFLRLDTMYP